MRRSLGQLAAPTPNLQDLTPGIIRTDEKPTGQPLSFASWQFIAVFFPAVVVLYFVVPGRRRWCLLLAASYTFYAAWKPAYLLLILASTLVDYLAALGMAGSRARKRMLLLFLSLAVNLGLLFLFKYFNFAGEAAAEILAAVGVQIVAPSLDLLLPIGISFYTFQTLGYTVDVYRGRLEPERHLGRFAVYVSFFPQLIAGPIERGSRLLPQLAATHGFQHERVAAGLSLMLWGFFKKLVIADRVAFYVDLAYADPAGQSGLVLAIATYLFAFQILCDFSAYSDIAVGCAQVLGVELTENFRRPYYAQSIREFWQRWHISLSTWFRDYVYLPLGGNRCSRPRWIVNVAAVFILSGVWHGANWTFLVWGALHALYYLFGFLFQPLRAAAARLLPGLAEGGRFVATAKILLTFHLVCFAWIFFRASSLGDALTVVERIATGAGAGAVPPGLSIIDLVLSLGGIAALQVVHLVQRKHPDRTWLAERAAYVRWPLQYLLVLSIILLGVYESHPFIYFQF